MATTMSTKQSEDSVNVEKESMFKRMIRKLKNKGSSEDSLDVGALANPKRAHRGPPGKPTTPPELVSTETSLHLPYDQNNPAPGKISPGQFNVFYALHHNRVSLKDREVIELKARVADLQSEKTQESIEAAAKIRELEGRLVDQATNTRHRISQKDQEIESLTASVAKLEAEKKGFDEARSSMLSQTLQAKNVLIDPRPILQEIQKIRKSNDERMAHQQEMVRKLRKQVEANKGFVKQLKQGEVLKDTTDTRNHKEANQKAAEVPQILLNGVPLLDAEEQEEAVQKAAEVPQILINGVPLLDAEEQEEAVQKAAEVPQILINGVPLLDAEEQEEAVQKAAEVPQILINGVPLLDAEEHEEEVQKVAEVPQILINGVPLLDAEEQEEAVQKAAEVPQILINGVPLLDAEEQEEAVQKAAEVPQILINGVPLLDAEEQEEAVQKAAEVPQILINGVPLLDAEEHEEEVQKVAEVPQILINGVPLLDAEEQEEAVQKAAEVPQILINGVPPLDAEEQEEAVQKAAEVPQILINGVPLLDAEEHEEAVQKAAEVPQILINGVPLLDAEEQEEAVQKAAEVPQILINGVPLLDAEEQEEAVQKVAEVPQILINGVPLLDAEEHEEAVQKAAEVPQILINGVPLLDAEEQEEAVQKAAEVPQILINGVPLLDAEEHEEADRKADIPHCIPGSPTNESEKEEETFGKGLASQQNTSLSAGDASIETTVNTAQQPLRIPEFFVVHSFPRSLVAHRLPPNCTMDPVPLQVHFVPNDGCASGEIYYDLDSWADAFEAAMDAMDSGLGDFHCASPYPARKSASFPAQACSTHVLDDWLKPFDPRQRDSIISRASLKDLPTKSEVGSGDMKPQSPGVPSSWWKPEKPSKYQEFGEPSMSLLDFTAADEPRGLEVLIEKKAPCQFWCAPPALVRGDESRGLESVLENSKDSRAVQQKTQLTNMFDMSSTNDMAAVSGLNVSHSAMSMQVNTSPATEGEDTVRDDPVTFEPCFLLALLTHRIKRGYRLSTHQGQACCVWMVFSTKDRRVVCGWCSELRTGVLCVDGVQHQGQHQGQACCVWMVFSTKDRRVVCGWCSELRTGVLCVDGVQHQGQVCCVWMVFSTKDRCAVCGWCSAPRTATDPVSTSVTPHKPAKVAVTRVTHGGRAFPVAILGLIENLPGNLAESGGKELLQSRRKPAPTTIDWIPGCGYLIRTLLAADEIRAFPAAAPACLARVSA
ncbi:hypothetical protein Bbelb_181920 [Branchiostoma belcheri]|nr:hypothetical protein Bbelb_181920 [Branchiostoma belcheri]